MDAPWRIELFGGLRLLQNDRIVSRFKSTKNGALLAYLAYYHQKPVFREAVTELFWPDAEIEAGRNNLRVALNSLRRQLEPPGLATGAVLVADRIHLSLNPTSFQTDIDEYEEALRREQHVEDDAERVKAMTAAVALYRGDLLAGWPDEWIEPERTRLADLYLGALRRLTRILVEQKDYDRALECAHKALAADPLREQSHSNLMRLYSAMGRPAAALQQYKDLVRIFKEELGASPSSATRELARQLAEGIERLPSRQDSSSRAIEAPRSRKKEAVAVAAPGGEISSKSPGNVPIQFNRFFGRLEELQQLEELLAPVQPEESVEGRRSRLVTVTGSGGAGKTRLAIEAAVRLRSVYDGHIWFVGLSETTDARLIGAAIAASMRLPRIPQSEPLDQVLEVLAQAPSLLVLDNMEQLAEEGGQFIQTILENAPTTAFLVTSQLGLGIPGEQEFMLPPLPAPDSEGTPEEMLEWASVRLFVDRAQVARPDFQLTARNVPAVVDLCRRLEGIPLAIELAAAWAQVLTPAQMAERLAARFDLLVHPRKAASARHRTLRAAIEWSYRLLSPSLQQFFASLSLFRGGWTVEAAAKVCGEDEATVLDYLNQLRGRSLVVVQEGAAGMRFRMLESLREYAVGQLPEEVRAEVTARHAEWALQLAEEACSQLRCADSATWMERLSDEHDNLRAALEVALQKKDTAAVGMAASLWRFWYGRGHVTEGRRWLAQSLASADGAPDSVRAEALQGAGRLAAAQGDYVEARSMYQQSLDLYRSLSNFEETCILLANLGMVTSEQADYDAALELGQERLALQRETGDRLAIARALDSVAHTAVERGDNEQAGKALDESLSLRRELNDRWSIIDTLYSLAQVADNKGDKDRATALKAEAAQLQESLDDRYGIAYSFLNLGCIAAEQGDYPEARTLLQDGLALLEEIGDKSAVALAHKKIAEVSVYQNDSAGALESLKALYGIRLSEKDEKGLAVCLTIGAHLAALCDQPVKAARLLGAAAAARGQSGSAGADAMEENSHSSLPAKLGEATFKQEWCKGAELNPQQAFTELLSAVASSSR
jgi:predicted ATPase/DNA-binding SARP family transcriptional activator